METWDAIRSRRDVRQFADRPVPAGGRRLPSTNPGNEPTSIPHTFAMSRAGCSTQSAMCRRNPPAVRPSQTRWSNVRLS
ncbi:hypothetical protein Pfl04_43900 [Planosporangium flavigriseum]|uniref:Uncharacterized protein n=1 Tax=Planosporangium flavigriseum TaxID=373681 RepID=A0A8J3PQD6_9ACTN|nr:hypothetical protein Pfl04_43900 [Planosporangium flavigriseum]